ncbi:MAG TPA: glycosyltransferase, partial [Terriglobales bacterium]
EPETIESGGLLSNTLSVIIRFHKRDRLSFLDEALFSLALQYWRDLEVIVCVQNGSQSLLDEVTNLLSSQPWVAPICSKVICVAVSEDTDGRVVLLNRGIEEAKGRYLAFLDDDDVVYQHGYKYLIDRLRSSELAVAVGGCRVAQADYTSGHWFVTSKRTPFSWGRTRFDLLRDNFIPIHSYVIDRARVKAADLRFDSNFTLLEDYEFLLRLSAQYEFDFAGISTPVCEYRVRNDGSNSIPFEQEPVPEVRAALERARSAIEDRKRNLRVVISPNEVQAIREQITALERRLEHEQSIYRSSPVYKVAWKVNAFLTRHEKIGRLTNRFVMGLWGRYKKLKAGVAS